MPMTTYYLMLREEPTAFANLSPAEMQAIVERYVAWRKGNTSVTGGEKLADDEGHVLRRGGSALELADGPFAEAKEVLGGFFVIEAPDYAAALAIAKTCPHLEFGSIEVRAVDPHVG